MRAHVALVLVAVGLFSACASAVAPGGGQDVAALSVPFVLQEGNSVVVGPDRVTVTFDKVLSESRCPEGAQCIQEGEASIRLLVTPAGGTKTELTVSTRRDRDAATVGALTVKLAELRPVPRLDAPARREPYRATLVVTSTP